jgi:hypothetical protein
MRCANRQTKARLAGSFGCTAPLPADTMPVHASAKADQTIFLLVFCRLSLTGLSEWKWHWWGEIISSSPTAGPHQQRFCCPSFSIMGYLVLGLASDLSGKHVLPLRPPPSSSLALCLAALQISNCLYMPLTLTIGLSFMIVFL